LNPYPREGSKFLHGRGIARNRGPLSNGTLIAQFVNRFRFVSASI
jgi:hypothetical protein